MIPVCAEEVITADIKTLSITIDELVVKNLNVSHVVGAHKLNATIFDAVSALHNIDFSTKLLTGNVSAKNITVSKIKGINLEGKKTIKKREAFINVKIFFKEFASLNFFLPLYLTLVLL